MPCATLNFASGQLTKTNVAKSRESLWIQEVSHRRALNWQGNG